MNDNDLISRMELYEKTAEWEAQALHMVELHMRDDDKSEWRKWSTVLAERSAFKHDVADAPAVPQEMSAREYIREYRRMCDFYFGKPSTDGGVRGCGDCPGRLNGKKNCIFSPTRDESSIPIVEEWAQEHPEVSE